MNIEIETVEKTLVSGVLPIFALRTTDVRHANINNRKEHSPCGAILAVIAMKVWMTCHLHAVK